MEFRTFPMLEGHFAATCLYCNESVKIDIYSHVIQKHRIPYEGLRSSLSIQALEKVLASDVGLLTYHLTLHPEDQDRFDSIRQEGPENGDREGSQPESQRSFSAASLTDYRESRFVGHQMEDEEESLESEVKVEPEVVQARAKPKRKYRITSSYNLPLSRAPLKQNQVLYEKKKREMPSDEFDKFLLSHRALLSYHLALNPFDQKRLQRLSVSKIRKEPQKTPSLEEVLKPKPPQNVYYCQLCGPKTTYNSRLVVVRHLGKHIRKEVNLNKGRIECVLCEVKFESEQALDKHIRLKSNRHRAFGFNADIPCLCTKCMAMYRKKIMSLKGTFAGAYAEPTMFKGTEEQKSMSCVCCTTTMEFECLYDLNVHMKESCCKEFEKEENCQGLVDEKDQ